MKVLDILVPKIGGALACCGDAAAQTVTTVTTVTTPVGTDGGTVVPGLQTNSAPFSTLGEVLNVLVPTSIIVAGLAALVFLILGGFQYLTSGGDKIAAQAARDRIIYAIIGLVIIVAAVALIQVIGAVFGFNIVGNISWPGPARTVGTP